jgi:hypothetical protein
MGCLICRGSLLACVFAICAAVLTAPAHAAWQQVVGGTSPINQAAAQDAGDVNLTSINGVPYIAWAESDGANGELRVSRLSADGSAWEQIVGGPSPINQSPTFGAFGVSLTGIAGVPYVAWHEFDGVNNEVRVSRLAPDGSAWQQLVGGASPVNLANNQNGIDPSLTSIAGVPYVAWSENDGTNTEIRVSRFNAAGPAWVQVVPGASPINQAPTRNGAAPSLTEIGGVPYVAWTEVDGTNSELRVSRLNGAGTAWEQPVGGASPINQANNRNASHPSLTAIDGVPYVAWEEVDNTNSEIRVSRLNAAGTAWEQLVGGASPINQADSRAAFDPSLTSVGGVPYVAWREDDGVNDEIRVSRLNAAGTAWEQVVGGASPINQANDRSSGLPSLTDIGGVPYVAWSELDPSQKEARVSRLEPEFVSQSAAPATTGATLTATVKNYGIGFPIGFEYGESLENETTPQTAQLGADETVITEQISGLAPSSPFAFRPFAIVRSPEPNLFGPTRAFVTLAEPPAPPTPPDADTTPPETAIDKKPANKLDGSKAKYEFSSTEPGSTFECKLDRAAFKACTSPARLKHLKTGKHKFSVRSIDAAGNADPSPAKDKFKVV